MLHATSDPLSNPRDSATIVLLRDGSSGLEVFLQKRSGLSDAFGEAYVFPGGKLDDHDSTPAAVAALDVPAEALARQLGEPDLSAPVAAGLYVAALRELFEEAGVLLAAGSTHPASVKPEDWQAWVAASGATLQASALVPWSRWITPRMAALSKKRFDTRFFLALAPTDQEASHDNFETTASIWLAPQEALLRYHRGEIEMAPPQIMSLAHLARYGSAAEAMHAARQRLPPCICPENFTQDGEVILCYPGDPQHSVPTRALPGPTRLAIRNKRFVPVEGLESLWA
ncbi:NUDIX hydrolase [Rhodoferax saidenbachensis]|uniref:8-oxo-dGTP pyrophosphatase MutT (NUDIX family) n=1 Tax=Rhodoferax saidenbachensis TaxID=1484693 RepID=A0ABU1ZLB0_9BURK|nr:NUDIX hydrolase [Rhodoferax saidenbachensis]MDR7306336.1 8-oxo-dGTP pyrophosphatase MutT (NUDIX family) [Rhodoferax saidenbachensis]